MKDGKQRARPDGTIVPSGRGTYAKQACSHCRKRKSKCDGRTPVCGPCEKAGRASECTWGKETAKKARTQQHFESLENYIRALEAKIKDLQADLEYCRRNHGGPAPSGSSDAGAGSSDPSGRAETATTRSTGSDGNDDSGSSNNESDIDHLITPTRHLVLSDNDLEYHGPTSVWRLAPQRGSPSVSSDAKASASPEPSPASVPGTTYFDWSRHLPPEVPLTRAEHDRLLEILFKFFSSWGLRIVPELFLRDMHRALTAPPNLPPPKSAHYSPMLHNAVLALATAYTDDPLIKDMRYRQLYARKAKSYIESECQRPTIPLITALGVLAAFHSAAGEQSLGYLYFGMAGRMSQALGLNIDCSPWVKSGLITHEDMLDRNWAYWATFSQDVLWSLYVGRECCVLPPRKDRQIPLPWVGSEIDQAPWYWAPCKMPPQPSHVVRTFEKTCELMLIARKIMDFVNSLGPGSKREGALQIVSEMDIQLNNWKDSLSPEVDLTAASRPNALPHRLMLHLTYWWLLLLLHRPFYRRSKSNSSGPDIDHVKLCNRAGDNIMLLLGIWNDKYSVRYLPITLMQVIFCAGTSFILSAVQATSGPRLGRVALTSALAQAEQCIRYLLICGKSFDCANHVASILSTVLHEQLKPRLLLRTLEPRDLLPPKPMPEQSQDQQQQTHGQSLHDYGQYNGGAPGANMQPDTEILNLDTTITNLDTLRDQCRYSMSATASSSSSAGSEWHTPDSFSMAPTSPVGAGTSAASAGSRTQPLGTVGGGGPGMSTGPGGYGIGPSAGLNGMGEDVEMDFGLTGMDLGIMGGQPLSNRPYMAFGIPELPAPILGNGGSAAGGGGGGGGGDAGYPDLDAPPAPWQQQQQQSQQQQSQQQQQVQQQQQQQQQQSRRNIQVPAVGALGQSMPLDFSPEELAVMDQILRQQFNGHQGMDYRVAGPSRYG
ncbi:hypothetical protein PYCCODRAFT_1439733 [Trametes coccinea BRFM310]|uniref:Zn(2)-C6 fungal-type domain-containing protein n=1 Tax=Trametes coccinea (strain BRFM310) TaxID=1353009 RepID=A0A1Y2I9X4_TRAC3|nr:hypothetical protein PYCCODRAFT_1439733 [Trametes coccinea BRFM310]